MTREPTEMELRVAEAMWADASPDITVPFKECVNRALWIESARVAIRAMRDPTPEMIGAEFVYKNCHLCGGANEQYPRMIQAASPGDE